MKSHRFLNVLSIAIVIWLVLPVSTLNSASLASGVSTSASQPWEFKTFATNYPVNSISTALAGPNQHPLFSYDRGDQVIYLAMPAIAVNGNCGPSNSWKCLSYAPVGDIRPGTISPVTTHTLINTFYAGWAFHQVEGNRVYAYYLEFTSDLQFTGATPQLIYMLEVNSSAFPETVLVGRPSLAFDNNGRPQVALVLRDVDYDEDSLIYISFDGEFNTTCGFFSVYRCDIIQTLYRIGGNPLLSLTDSGSPRITYYDANNDYLYYAYPRSSALYHPNCGPGGNTWRCVVIESTAYGTLGMEFSMAASAKPNAVAHPFHVAYTNTVNATQETQLTHAEYVGVGGNCGSDYVLVSDFNIQLLPVWRCTWVTTWNPGPPPAYIGLSIQVDELGYPVIAYNREGPTYDLALAFPAARIGAVSGNCRIGSYWECRKLEGKGVNTGNKVSLLLKSSGIGFAAYIEEAEYSPNLRIARQHFEIHLPYVRR